MEYLDTGVDTFIKHQAPRVVSLDELEKQLSDAGLAELVTQDPVLKELLEENQQLRLEYDQTKDDYARTRIESKIEENNTRLRRAYIKCLRKHLTVPFPKSPPLRAAIRAIYSAKKLMNWEADESGRPFITYISDDGHITISFDKPPKTEEAAAALLDAVSHELSVETAGVFLILMSRIAELRDPRDIAGITLREIAEYRGVDIRHGSARTLYADLKAHVLAIAKLHITLIWKDYRTGKPITIGKDRPDRLLDIVDWEYEGKGRTLTGFTFRCGQAILLFLDPNYIRWIGYCSRALLKLDPYRDALAWKIGMYWLTTTINNPVNPTPLTILEDCGEAPDNKFPNRTVDEFIKAHNRLIETGLLLEAPNIEPPSRTKGYFAKWLQTPISVTMPPYVWDYNYKKPLPQLPAPATGKLEMPQGDAGDWAGGEYDKLVFSGGLIKKYKAGKMVSVEKIH